MNRKSNVTAISNPSENRLTRPFQPSHKSSPSHPSHKSSSPSSASSQSTDAAVAQILRKISQSMAASAAANSLSTTAPSQLDVKLSSPAVAVDMSDINLSPAVPNTSSVDNFLDMQTGYHESFQSISPSSLSKTFNDSIRQDVMLSSADITSTPDILSQDDSLTVHKPVKLTKVDLGNKRRLSEDLDSQRKNFISIQVRIIYIF